MADSAPAANSAIQVSLDSNEIPEQIRDKGDSVNNNATGDDNLSPKLKKQKRSHVWSEIIEVEDPKGDKYKCKHCQLFLAKMKIGTTTHLKRHLDHCAKHLESKKKLEDKLKQQQLLLGFESVDTTMPLLLHDGKFCMERMKEAAASWILMHEHPFTLLEEEGFNMFCRRGMPEWTRISRTTGKKSCFAIYEAEKKKLHSLLKNVTKISLTTDLWKSKNQKIEYMVITGHWIDSSWKLNKRVLNFFNIPPPRGGPQISDTLLKCARTWEIENKIYTVSVDNASANDAAIKYMKEDFLKINNNLICEGKLFHVRCCAHILNLIAQDGLDEIKDIIHVIRQSVDFIRRTDARLIQFAEIVKQLKLQERKLVDDCKTRWNSTYERLRTTIAFKEVFPRFKDREPNYVHCPTKSDWEKLLKVFSVLKVFYQATKIISGSEYPITNLFLNEVYRVKLILYEKSCDEEEFIRKMVQKMKEKFDKYWGECNLLMVVGSVLDPRCKMRLLEFTFPKLYNTFESESNTREVQKHLYAIYKEYAVATIENLQGSKSNSESQSSNSSTQNIREQATFSSGRSDSFSRVIDKYRASLAPATVEMLMCGGDWCRKRHGVTKKTKVEDGRNEDTECRLKLG
ncbi:hypothetical protein ZIOFF_039090 [Zingiber officinale]|uniref:BED-type domain-containing protein n=1 Tax=Zingiber officinale TaxID=94328 RepID=A0A8J5G3X5_ZINOF|nr:hypothetical protein ZIOFF_039090 [Zingiber officinale]